MVQQVQLILEPALEQKQHPEWLQKFRDLRQIEQQEIIQEELQPTQSVLTMGEVIHLLNELTEGNAIIVTDVGQHQMVTCRYARFNRSKSNITSGGAGTMGFALPAAIGAKFGAPDRTVVAVILILNNSFLGMVRQWQQLFHDRRYSFVDIASPDYVTVAKGYHIEGNRVEDRTHLKSAIQTMLDHQGAYLLEVKVGKENNVFPMVPQGCSVSEIRLK